MDTSRTRILWMYTNNNLETLKVEVERLCKLGVLKRVNCSQWAAPTFVIPKKDGTVRFISDFQELNKQIWRQPYPIPHIQDMLLNLEGFQYGTSLDLNMGYYHLELNEHSKELCTIYPSASSNTSESPWDYATAPTSSKRRWMNCSMDSTLFKPASTISFASPKADTKTT